MEKKCLSCKNAYKFFNGLSHCLIESHDSNCHYYCFCCQNYETIDEIVYNERINFIVNEKNNRK